MRKTPAAKGQAAVEFALLTPFLFLFFFCVIQAAYTAYVVLAVQRAALAAAREASLSPAENSTAFKTRLTLSLLPVVSLSPKTLVTIFETQCRVTFSPDQKQVTALVRYPMPIWIPILRNWFGETLVPSFDYNRSPEGIAVKNLFSLLHKPEPNFSFGDLRLPVRWVLFEETTFNESFGRRK